MGRIKKAYARPADDYAAFVRCSGAAVEVLEVVPTPPGRGRGQRCSMQCGPGLQQAQVRARASMLMYALSVLVCALSCQIPGANRLLSFRPPPQVIAVDCPVTQITYKLPPDPVVGAPLPYNAQRHLEERVLALYSDQRTLTPEQLPSCSQLAAWVCKAEDAGRRAEREQRQEVLDAAAAPKERREIKRQRLPGGWE